MKKFDHQSLFAQAISDPAGAYQVAIKANDIVGLAFVSLVEPGTEPTTMVAKFHALVSHLGTDSHTAELILGVIEQAEHLPPDLTHAATGALKEQFRQLPLNRAQLARAAAIVDNASDNEESRWRTLAWIWFLHARTARKKATELLSDPGQPHGTLARQALRIVGAERDSEARTVLAAYAKRHLEAGEGREPDAALHALNSITKPSADDIPTIGAILVAAAAASLSVGNNLKDFFRRISIGQLRSLVQELQGQGHATWLPAQFLPALILVRPADIAQSAGEPWWPPECRTVLASTAWEQHGDRLYGVVFEGLHRTGDETACAEIRQRVSQRCQATTSTTANDMPRLGIRALLKLALKGDIPSTDENLMAALKAADSSVLEAELSSASWRSPERAHRLGEIVAQLDSDVLVEMIATSLEGRPQTALALMSGASPSLDSEIDRILEMVEDNEAVLPSLCELSEAAAARTLDRWNRDHHIVSFRALKSSEHSDDRLAALPTAVRLYHKIGEAERAELLAEYGVKGDRLELLGSILGDWAKPGPKPSNQDLINALTLLADHFIREKAPDAILETVGVICREINKIAVRKAAYEALAKAPPTANVVDLLLEREANEAVSARPVAKAALQEMAGKLDEVAGDRANDSRTEAADLLARVDLARAVQHARDLLGANEAEDRKLAAEILAAGGSQEDAERLEAALADEPSADVRREFTRAIRRLKIGDSAAAHQRLGELADVTDPESWEALEPTAVYGQFADALVTGLDRVARAESGGDFGTAIDQLNEIARVLLFRTIELAGVRDEVTSKANQAKAATNDLQYGNVLGWQQLVQKWSWIHHFGALYELRTEHIAAKGTAAPPPERDAEDLRTALAFFKLGAQPCCALIRQCVT